VSLIPDTLTLNRTGLIKVRVTGANHCGDPSAIMDGRVTVRYTVRLVVSSGSLDARGFIVDQQALHNRIVDLGESELPWREPCELLSLVWSAQLLAWISAAHPHVLVRELELTLSPAPHAGSFTATFHDKPRQDKHVRAGVN